MKFVLAMALLCATSLIAFSQQQNHKPTPASETSELSKWHHLADSLRSDPAFQRRVGEMAEGLASLAGPTPRSILNTPLPDFALTSLDDQVITKEELAGQVTLLYVWHPDYLASASELAQLNQLKKTFKAQGVRFLAATTVQPKYLSNYLRQNPLHFVHLPAAFSLIRQITFAPQLFLIDRQGTIRYLTTDPFDQVFQSEPQPTDWPALRRQIDQLLQE